LASLLKRKPAKLAAVAPTNKPARIAWNLKAMGQHYDPFHDSPVKAMLTA